MLLREYGRADFERFTNATQNNVTHWARVGLLKPDVRDTHGIGHRRRFTFRALVEAEIAAVLNDDGAKVEGIKALLEVFRYVTYERVGTTPAFKQWLQTTPPAEIETLRAHWKAFIDPQQRDKFGFVGLVIGRRESRFWFCVDGVDEPFNKERILTNPISLVINVGEIIRGLEDITGDRWPTGTATESRKPKQRR